MANRKKYNEKIRMLEVQRKRRLRKKLKRQKMLAGRKREQQNQPAAQPQYAAPQQMAQE